MHFRIDQRLPSLNDYIAANRANKYLGAKMKRETEEIIGFYINAAVRLGTLHSIKEPVVLRIEWHEKTKKRDADNIQSGQKYILDALQKQGIIPNDSRRFVRQIYHEIVDDTEDYVEVILEKAPVAHDVKR